MIDSAEREIEMAAYVLTDWPVMQALTRAADRGVAIRIYLDGTQLAEREPAKVFLDLAETPGVEIRVKRKSSDPCTLRAGHLQKPYANRGVNDSIGCVRKGVRTWLEWMKSLVDFEMFRPALRPLLKAAYMRNSGCLDK